MAWNDHGGDLGCWDLRRADPHRSVNKFVMKEGNISAAVAVEAIVVLSIFVAIIVIIAMV